MTHDCPRCGEPCDCTDVDPETGEGCRECSACHAALSEKEP